MSPENIDDRIILDAAAEEFAQKGFEGARVDSIAKRAGINKAMLYYRIGNKEELYKQVVLNSQAIFQKAILAALEDSPDAPEAVKSILSSVSEKAVDNKLIPSIILREMAGNAKTLPKAGAKGLERFMKTVKSVVTCGIEDGVFRNIDPVTLQFLVVGGIFSLSLTKEIRAKIDTDDSGPNTAEEIANSITDILLHGIMKEGAN